MMPLISVVVPVYKVEKYLARCVESILKQSLSDIEIILVDDGSTDRCGEICDEFALKDKRVRVLHKENGGLSSARNAGMQRAEGRYILFVDSDDWIEPDMLEVMYNEADISMSDMVICNYKKVFNSHIEEKRLKLAGERIDVAATGLEAYFFKYILTYAHGSEAWNKLYAAKIIKENNISFEPNVEVFAEDMLFNLYYLCHVTKISAVDVGLYNYFQREDSIICSRKPEFAKQHAALFVKFNEYYCRRNRINEIKKAVPYILYILMFICMKHIAKEKDCSAKDFIHFSAIHEFRSYMKQIIRGYGFKELKELAGFSFKRRVKIRILALLFYLKMFKTSVWIAEMKQGWKRREKAD